uniref:Uncharacterized protein n=1 Tax=Magallana gigas TaxID=29159 RepID=K1R5D4_MAGGI
MSRDPDRGDLIRHGRVLDFLSRLLRPPTAGCQGRHFYSADGRDMSGQPATIRHSRPPLRGGYLRFLDHGCHPLSGN